MQKTVIALYPLIALTFITCTNNAGKITGKDSSIAQETSAPTIAGVDDYADKVNNGLITDTLKGSPVRVAAGNINGKHIQIEYGSPGVKGRIIWGGLVPYEKVWVTGAHRATNISFSNDVLFGDRKIAAGKYALFTVPAKESWTVILNKNYDQHQADAYKESDDVARIMVQPATNEKIVQRLTYTIDQTGEQQGKIIMQWEKISISIPLRFD